MSPTPPTSTGSRWQRSAVPTLLERGSTRRVFDGAVLDGNRNTINEYATVNAPGSGLAIGLVLLAVVAAGVATPLVYADGFWSVLLWGLGGAAVAFVVGMILYAALVPDPARTYRKERGTEPFVDVEEGSRGGRLCDLATAVAGSTAWRDGRVDPDRLLPATLWHAVRLARHVDDQEQRVAGDRAGGLDERVLAPTVADLDAARDELDRVETNLREIAALARELDARAAAPERAVATMPPAPDAGLAAAGSDAILGHARTLRDLL
ncbi:hypothetical protein WIS52_12615 [Pseudonocardia nematodicida]|uniref:Uncharacterized protein n=1 Tax=Pseudonocardia nematodicida TaxID=1206997 RepID=A0ABV1KBQ4_9PSEU